MDPKRYLGLYPPSLIPEAEIVSALTRGGTIPLGQVFLLGDTMESWAPESECLLVIILEDASLSQACRDYLGRKGHAFSSLNEVAARAEAERWPKYDVLNALVKGVPGMKPIGLTPVHWTRGRALDRGTEELLPPESQ